MALIACKADASTTNEQSETVLIWASVLGFAGAVRALLTAKADVHNVDNSGDTGLSLAEDYGHDEGCWSPHRKHRSARGPPSQPCVSQSVR